MERRERSVLREGVVGGLIGAAVVAVWFLLFDLVRGHPFRTPALLADVLFRHAQSPAGVVPTAGAVLGYTVVHGLAFIAFGVLAAALVAAAEREPPLFIAFVMLFACFEIFFLGVLAVLRPAIADALSWWAMLGGNLLAAVAMLAFFLRRHRGLPRTLVGSWGAVLREGVVAGLIGAAVVALWFFAIDALQGAPLRTPGLLGTALLGQSTPLAAVLLYTVAHGLAFVAFGIAGAVLLAGAERQPAFVFALGILFTAFETFFFALLLIAARWVLGALAGWTIFAANLLASASMLAYYLRGHRTLVHRVTEVWAREE